jgi:hypothetical protein
MPPKSRIPKCYLSLRNALVDSFEEFKETQGTKIRDAEKALLIEAFTDRVARPFAAEIGKPTLANFENMDLTDPPLLGEFVKWFKEEFPNVPINAKLPSVAGKRLASDFDSSTDNARAKKTRVANYEPHPSESDTDPQSSDDDAMGAKATSRKKSAPRQQKKAGTGSQKKAEPKSQKARRRILSSSSSSSDDESFSNDEKATAMKKKEVPPPKAIAPETMQAMIREMVHSGNESVLQQLRAELQKTASAIKDDAVNHLQAQAQSTKAELAYAANQVGRITLDTLNEHTRDGAAKLASAYGALEQAQSFAMYAEQIQRQQTESAALAERLKCELDARAALSEQKRHEEEAARLALEHEARVMLLEQEAARKAIVLERQAFGAVAHAEFERLRLEKEANQRAKEDAIRNAMAREQEIEARAAELIRKLRIENMPQGPPPPPAQVNIRLQAAPQPVTEDVVASILARERDLMARRELPAVAPTNVTPVKKRTLDETDDVHTSQKRKRSSMDDDDDTPSKGGSFLKDVIDGVSVVTRFVTGVSKKPKAASGM